MAGNGSGTVESPTYSAGYKALVLVLLLATYTFNFIDRSIINIIGQAIKVDLKLTDTQLGLLGGFYFAILYTLLGIPIARIAERTNRVSVISVSLVIWSAFTALCGTAGSFATLAAYRFGVGFGEAGGSPPSHSLISDYFPPKQRATALSIYSVGIPLGGMIAAVAGGWLTENFSWRTAYLIVGLPGILLALLVRLVIKEPPRGHSEAKAGDAAYVKPPLSLGTELREMGAVVAALFFKWPVVNMILGVTLVSFAGYGTTQFALVYVVRAFHLKLSMVGLVFGLIAGASTMIGTLVGGFLPDRLGKRNAIWYPLTPAIGLMIATPISLLIYSQTTWQMMAMLSILPGIFSYTYLAPTFGVVQNSVAPHRRATATAVLFLFLNLIALGGGPVFTGWLIDHIANANFGRPPAGDVVQSVLGALQGPDSTRFTQACPGGVAPKGSVPALAKACAGTLVEATREGIMVTYLFAAWGSLHFFLATLGIVKHMRERAEAQA
jgi:MFS family permease